MKLIRCLLLFVFVGVFFNIGFGNLRVISLSPNTTEIIHEIISLVPKSQSKSSAHLVGSITYPGQPAYYQNLENIGSFQALNIEKILNLKPDLVITWQYQTPQQTLVLLKRFGIKVKVFQADNLQTLAKSFVRIGQVIGLKKQGQALAKQFSQALLAIRPKNFKIQPKVFLQLSNRPVFTIGGQGILNDIIEFCGGKNIFSKVNQISFEVNPAAILEYNPDFIIQTGSVSQNMFQRNAQSTWQKWPMLAAVKHKHIFVISGDSIAQYSLKIITGITQICDILHKS
ncbi:ABC transporter substrate-binding protein [Facilibium subflavum]|uniref:ABC transporter substrate-binding protein n=1 Tax=Facilibium subflavum TaxID=2219058 RepID=UPI0013C2F2F5|nr:ABC transporter substrate-binding protein [Facilibium subflavum]